MNPEENIIEGAGIPIITDGKSAYVDNSEAHTLIIGSTGSGKTRKIILPQINFLRLNKESIIVTDPKGELFESTSGSFHNDGYRVVVLNFRDPLLGDAWNPLDIPYHYFLNEKKVDKAMEMLNDLALNIIYDKDSHADPFWQQSSVDYFIGLAMGLFEDGEEKQINLNNINRMSQQGQERCGASTYLQEYFKLKGPYSAAYICANGTINAPSDTKGGILSVFHQKIRVFTSQKNLSKMLSYSSFKMENIGVEPTIVYLIIQDEKSTYHPLASAFIKQCYEVLIENAILSGGKLKIRTNFILDEFGNLPPIIDMNSIVSAARSRNIRLTLAIQSNKQLESLYSISDSEVIKNNCNNYVYLYGRDLQTLKEISELCGKREEQLDFNTFEQKPLISTSQLQHLKDGEAIVLTKENYPYRSRLVDITKYNFKKYEPYKNKAFEYADANPFDIQKIVKDAKLKTMFDSQNSIKADVLQKVTSAKEEQSISKPILKKDELSNDSSNELPNIIEESLPSSDLLISHYSMKARDAYEEKNFAEAEKYFTKLYYINEKERANIGVNLAYMKRRGETQKLLIPISDLLDFSSLDATSMINLALCYICGFEVNKDWKMAVEIVRKIDKNKSHIENAIQWWSDSETCGEAESNLVLLLLKGADKLSGSTHIELKQRLDQAIADGYNLPPETLRNLKYGI